MRKRVLYFPFWDHKIRLAACVLAIALFSGFIIPAYKMAELMKAQKGMAMLVLTGNAFFNLGKEYFNTPVPCRVIIRSDGYVKQDYMFPKANVNVIYTEHHENIIINNVRVLAPVTPFSQQKVFTALMELYLSDNPQKIFNEIGINQSQVAYGLANDRAAYIIGSDNNQLFIDNEDTVPLMYRIVSAHVYQLAVVKDYLDSAELANNNAKLTIGPHLSVAIDSYTRLDIILPKIVELYNGDTLVQRWEFSHAVVLPGGISFNNLLLSTYEIKKLPVTNQSLSPFMLF